VGWLSSLYTAIALCVVLAGGADPAAMMAGMSINDNTNAALIRMLAEEVVSLRK